jgi:hypothetical protein
MPMRGSVQSCLDSEAEKRWIIGSFKNSIMSTTISHASSNETIFVLWNAGIEIYSTATATKTTVSDQRNIATMNDISFFPSPKEKGAFS